MEKGKRYNRGKPRLSLIPASAKAICAKVLEFGADKYGKDNWRNGLKWTEIVDSMERHLDAFKEGYDIDEESGLPHVGHIMCNACFLAAHFMEALGEDDRTKKLLQEVIVGGSLPDPFNVLYEDNVNNNAPEFWREIGINDG